MCYLYNLLLTFLQACCIPGNCDRIRTKPPHNCSTGEIRSIRSPVLPGCVVYTLPVEFTHASVGPLVIVGTGKPIILIVIGIAALEHPALFVTVKVAE